MNECKLCTAYQKFYSSLLSLDDFIKTKDFLIMVSSLDKFLSEFRTITLVLQKSISGSSYNKKYEELRIKYLSDEKMKWLRDKRNEVLKESPFNLKKIIIVNAYFFGKSNKIIDNSYTYENWENAKQLTNQIKNKLKQFDSPEIYLSIKIKFAENENEIDIIELIKFGITNICNFFDEFSKELDDECISCKKIKNRIQKLITNITASKLMFERDYEYIPKTNTLEQKCLTETMGVKGINVESWKELRVPVKDNFFFGNATNLDEMFENFISYHVLLYALQKRHIMPTIFIFYNDDTFSLDTFLAESKSTMYRKINTVASNIDTDKIVAVFVVWESYAMNIESTNMNERYEKRVENSEQTLLCFYSINKALVEKSTVIDSELIEDNEKLPKIVRDAILSISNEMKWQLFSSLKYGFAKTYHKYLNLDKL